MSLIDPAHPFASWYLLVLGVVFSIVFAVPLMLSPVWWARRFQWWIPEDTRLVVYLGRCVGALAVALLVACFRAMPEPAGHVWLFDLIVTAGVTLALVHVVGAIQRIQPWTEHAEIVLYAGATALAWAARGTLA